MAHSREHGWDLRVGLGRKALTKSIIINVKTLQNLMMNIWHLVDWTHKMYKCREFLVVVIDDQTVVALVRTVVVVGQLMRCQSLRVGTINVGANIFDVRIDHGWIDEVRRRHATVVRPETLRWRRMCGRRRFLSAFLYG